MPRPTDPDLGPRNGPQYQERYRDKYKDRLLCFATKHRALKSGITFNLEPEDIVIPDVCPVLGIPLHRNVGGKSSSDNSPSIDRVIPELGYTKGNIQVISQKANRMKNDALPDELRKFAEWVRNTFPL